MGLQVVCRGLTKGLQGTCEGGRRVARKGFKNVCAVFGEEGEEGYQGV